MVTGISQLHNQQLNHMTTDIIVGQSLHLFYSPPSV